MKIGLVEIGLIVIATVFIYCCIKISGDDK